MYPRQLFKMRRNFLDAAGVINNGESAHWDLLMNVHLRGKQIVFSVLTAALPVASFLACAAFAAETDGIASPPLQPKLGPGGSTYQCGGKRVQSYGEGDHQYWIYEPENPSPKSAPVIVFSHGWGAMQPGPYDGWVDHLVKRGNIVIYPRYQESLVTDGYTFVDNAAWAVKDALAKLNSEPGHVRPQTDKMAAVGHSAGGLVAAGLAAVAQQKGLPVIKAVMCVEPGKTWGPPNLQLPLGDMKKIPAATLLLAVYGDQDEITRDIDARRIYNETKNVPKSNKNLVQLVSDDHGTPPLSATHFCPTSPAPRMSNHAERMRRLQSAADGVSPTNPQGRVGTIRQQFFQRQMERFRKKQPGAFAEENETAIPVARAVNALDFGLWKLFDGLTDAAFFGKNRQYALGNTIEMRYMGKWSDGVPVKELKVVQ